MTGARTLFDHDPPRYFTIDAGRPFLRLLARGLTDALADDGPFGLADARVYLPTRRAARALADAFLSLTPGNPARLLPRMLAVGDVDDDVEALFDADAEDELDLPPAVSTTERLIALARLVAARDRAFRGNENWPAALAAARELGKLIDSFYTEEIGFERLQRLVPDAFAEHWGHSLDFLKIVTEAWPRHLAALGRLDPAERRALAISRQAERWRRAPPTTPVIIAGTTGSMPAVRRLIAAAAALPRGAVVLPGLDRALDARGWAAVDDPHPQAGLKALLTELKLEPSAVNPFPYTPDGGGDARRALLSLALRPAEATDDWRMLVEAAAASDPALAAARAGLTLVEAENEHAEADAVALILRETLETPGRTALLVTPDRNLARRVALKMRRWGVVVDDSGGTPLANTACGAFLRLVARWLCAPDDPVALTALMRHPLAGFGLDGRRLDDATAALDLALRGVRPTGGLAMIRTRLTKTRDGGAADPILSCLDAAIVRWRDAGGFAERATAHALIAEMFAARSPHDDGALLWRGADGEEGARLMAFLTGLGDVGGFADGGDYADAFAMLASAASVRPRADTHPRLAILGPLEARLQFADDIVLAGLSEGVWPADAVKDPFLSRPMRADVGLPSPERRMGLAAHDFAQLAAAPSVTLTRARKSGGSPANPSRWLVRLKTILSAAGGLDAIDRTSDLAAWATTLDAAEVVRPVGRPAPRPPLEARPRELSVTRVETWLRDPYAIYADKVLGLKRKDPVAEPFGPKHMGMLLHKVFERAARESPPPETLRGRLDAILFEEAPRYGLDATALGFWRASLAETLDWFAAFDANQRAAGAPAIIEEKGSVAFDAPGGAFTLTARPDRIDRLQDGRCAIFDYKSRRLPSNKQSKTFSPQLVLTAHMAQAGGFAALGPADVAHLAYLRIVGRRENAKANESALEAAEITEAVRGAAEDFATLVAAFDDPQTPYLPRPNPEFTTSYGDYDQLSRKREWGASEDGE